MSKALEILELMRGYCNDVVHKCCDYNIYLDLIDFIDTASDDVETMEARIAELEEAIKPKTCEGCKHNEKGRFIPSEKYAKCFFLDTELKNHYEPKDNA